MCIRDRTGIESDTLLVQSFPVNDRDSRRTDTVAMQNGSFAFNLGNSKKLTAFIDMAGMLPSSLGFTDCLP